MNLQMEECPKPNCFEKTEVRWEKYFLKKLINERPNPINRNKSIQLP